MQEKSNIELLQAVAKRTNRNIEFKESRFPMSGVRRIPKFKRTIYMHNNILDKNLFVWYGNPYEEFGTHTIFCGAVAPIDFPKSEKIKIRKRFIVDKLHLIKEPQVFKSGSPSFDSKVVISGNNGSFSQKLFANVHLQHLIIEALKVDEFITISINGYNLDFVPELVGQSYISIMNPQSWYTDQPEIDELFRLINSISKILK